MSTRSLLESSPMLVRKCFDFFFLSLFSLSLFSLMIATEKEKRDKAIEHVRGFLLKSSNLSHMEMMKLWKGLYYCVWMSDKPRVQEELCENLSQIVHRLSWKDGLAYLSGFWETICREWRGIDRLRLNKFYNLMRCMLQDGFLMLKNDGWKRVDEYVEMIQEHALSSNPYAVTSIVMNVIQYWPVDLQGVGCEDGRVATRLMKPLVHLMGHCSEKAVLLRLQEKFVEQFTEENALGIDLDSIGRQCFRMGSDAATSQRNRKLLYRVSRAWSSSQELQEKEAPAGGGGGGDDDDDDDDGEQEEQPKKKKAKFQKRASQKVASGKVDSVIAHTPTAPIAQEDQEEEQVVEQKQKKKDKKKKKKKKKRSSVEALSEESLVIQKVTKPTAQEVAHASPGIKEQKPKKKRIKTPSSEKKKVVFDMQANEVKVFRKKDSPASISRTDSRTKKKQKSPPRTRLMSTLNN